MRKLLLTFDIEDFINTNAIYALRTVLELLEKHKLKGLFFITGHMAEKLTNFPDILDLLMNHKIGFHSSAHSVRPIIPEYTDVKNYRQAYSVSLERETAHINPLTGKVEGEGGIYFLRDLFSPKKIEAYRAPGNCWTPPHLEALVDLGIKFDFSSNIITSTPVNYRRVTFFPYPFIQEWEGDLSQYKCFLWAILKHKITVFDLHPTLDVNEDLWDSIYFRGNPPTLLKVRKKPLKEAMSLFARFELLLKQINFLRHTRLMEADTNLSTSNRDLTMNQNDVQKCYMRSIVWPKKFFNYRPKFIRNHFYEFFESACY